MKGALRPFFMSWPCIIGSLTGPRGSWGCSTYKLRQLRQISLLVVHPLCYSKWHKSWAHSAATAAHGTQMSWDGANMNGGRENEAWKCQGNRNLLKGKDRTEKILVVIEDGNKRKLREAWSQKMQFRIAVKSARLLHFFTQSYMQTVPARCWNSGY